MSVGLWSGVHDHVFKTVYFTDSWLVVWNIFFPIYWEKPSQLTNIFQMGWNHQSGFSMILFLRCHHVASARAYPADCHRMLAAHLCLSEKRGLTTDSVYTLRHQIIVPVPINLYHIFFVCLYLLVSIIYLGKCLPCACLPSTFHNLPMENGDKSIVGVFFVPVFFPWTPCKAGFAQVSGLLVEDSTGHRP